MIKEVVGVIIWTDRLNTMLNFYRDKLGLNFHEVNSEFVSCDWGGVKFGIGRHSKVTGKAVDPYRIMVNLGVDDIHKEYQLLRSNGVDFIRPPEQEHWGGWVSTISDPDGNIIQLMQLDK